MVSQQRISFARTQAVHLFLVGPNEREPILTEKMRATWHVLTLAVLDSVPPPKTSCDVTMPDTMCGSGALHSDKSQGTLGTVCTFFIYFFFSLIFSFVGTPLHVLFIHKPLQ